MRLKRPLALAALVLLGCAAASLTAYVLLGRRVGAVLAEEGRSWAPLQFTPLAEPASGVQRWGGGEVLAVANGPGGAGAPGAPGALLTGGAFGVMDGAADLGAGLPTLKACAVALWRGRPVAGLAAWGLFLRRDGHWEEFRTGFGTLHPRVLVESPGG